MKLWIYWFMAVTICSIIQGAIKMACGVNSPKLFSKTWLADFMTLGIDLFIAYFFYSAIKGEWILSIEELSFW